MLKAALPVTAPKHWNDETPNLYNLVLTVAQNGQVTEATGCKVGFRVLEQKTAPWGKQYYTINGQRIFLYGVNRHEMWLDGGCWVSPEHHAQELAQIKALNINSIRTSHYTCDPTLYDYCDQYGIYLFAEANVETAGDIDDPSAPINKGPSENDFEDGGSGPQDIVGPEPTQEEKEKSIIQRLGLGQASEMQLRLEPALLDRQKANVIPNRNHPSVIIWSLCNVAGSGSPYIHMHQWVSNYEEESRIIFFKSEHEGNTISNLDYPSPTAMLNYLEGTDPRPLILSEFAWSEVHGRGGFSDSYVFQNDFVKNHINFLGMYLWSWKDMSLWAYGSDIGVDDKLKAAGLQRYLGYQGMFMKQLYGAQQGHFALGAFACNGVVTGSNEYKPDAAELKAAYGRIRVTPVDLARGILSMENRYSFRNLKDYLLKWILTDGETSFASGEARIDLPAGQSFEDASLVCAAKTLTLPQLAEAIASAPRVPGGELFVNLQFVQSAKLDWVQAEMSCPRGTIDGDMAYAGTVHIDPTLVSTLQLAVEATPAPTAIPSGKIYRYTFGLRPISREGAYPTTREVTRLLQKSPIPDSLITGLMVDGTLADDFTPGTSCYTLETTRADYEALGQAALPKLELRTPAHTDLRKEVLAVQGDLVRALRITAQSMGAQEQLTLRWILTEKSPSAPCPVLPPMRPL